MRNLFDDSLSRKQQKCHSNYHLSIIHIFKTFTYQLSYVSYSSVKCDFFIDLVWQLYYWLRCYICYLINQEFINWSFSCHITLNESTSNVTIFSSLEIRKVHIDLWQNHLWVLKKKDLWCVTKWTPDKNCRVIRWL